MQRCEAGQENLKLQKANRALMTFYAALWLDTLALLGQGPNLCRCKAFCQVSNVCGDKACSEIVFQLWRKVRVKDYCNQEQAPKIFPCLAVEHHVYALLGAEVTCPGVGSGT